jgi:hypothetical protein
VFVEIKPGCLCFLLEKLKNSYYIKSRRTGDTEMKKELSINPWLSVWIKPRETIRALVRYNLTHRFLLLSAIYGFQYVIQASQYLSLGRDYSLFFILFISLILAVPVGYIMFNITSFFILWIGKLLKGKGSFKEVRAATYWSSVPIIATLILWGILMVTHGNSLFVAGYEKGVTEAGAIINVIVAILQIILGVWMIVIFLQMLGEVQGFSAWKALLNVIMAGISMFVVAFLISWGVSAIIQIS